jgi:uncharacterized protein
MKQQYDTISNPRVSESFISQIPDDLSRRDLVRLGIGLAAVAFFGPAQAAGETTPSPRAGVPFAFSEVPLSTKDEVTVPPEYQAHVLFPWGHPINGVEPPFKGDASNTAKEQALQAGMGHDGMCWFPLPGDPATASERGLLVLNHEYADQGLLYPRGWDDITSAEAVRKSQAAHGVSVIQVAKNNGRWQVVPSKYARRITAATPMRLAGPAAGNDLVKTSADPTGTEVLGTINNCASGQTPWGTYLTCEENIQSVFGTTEESYKPDTHQKRYGLTREGYTGTLGNKKVSVYRWCEFENRFNLAKEPNEPNRFGYVVEIDPSDPGSKPVKRTALGRFRHENAAVTLTADGRVVVYMGDDEKNECLYKFVSKGKYVAGESKANRDLLDEGTLYAARFQGDGTGVWLELTHGKNGLVASNGFRSQGDICIKTRQAADWVGATMMDRPEWVAVHPKTKEVFVTLTNNDARGVSDSGFPASRVDASNPRGKNLFGHIIRWKEAGNDTAATTFAWKLFLLAGDPKWPDSSLHGNVKGDVFACPDGLWFDPNGRILWIQTDVSMKQMSHKDFSLGNNMMLAADPETGTVRRFLTGPKGCEVTGVTMTPDRKTMFVNIQHPGEPVGDLSDPDNPKALSSWPDGPAGGRPRSATIAITRRDGGEIGS